MQQIKHFACELKIKCQLFIAGILFFASMAQGSSLIDAQFKMKHQSKMATSSSNGLLHLYKSFFAKSMYSHCQWMPSDSQYLKIMSRKCGVLKGSIMAVSRFMSESDAVSFTHEVVNDHGFIRFVDFGENCDAF